MWPASTIEAAEVRVRTTRACHSHLSMRWRVIQARMIRSENRYPSPIRVEDMLFGIMR
jgi:hypothetical protein